MGLGDMIGIKKEEEQEVEEESKASIILSFAIAILIALGFRSVFFEPFHIPSGSMKPNLVIGDYLFVSKLSYGLSKYSFPFGANFDYFDGRVLDGDKPIRGDVIVFRLPSHPSTNYIKRVIGLPGDRVQIKAGVVYLNGAALSRKPIEPFVDAEGKKMVRYMETLPSGREYEVLDDNPVGPLDNTEEYVVPDGHYFFLGDNRDNSQDSRVLSKVGYIPEVNLVGRADVIFFSSTATWWKVWTWFTDVHASRILDTIE